MFWDHVAWIYDVFANGVNRKANRALCATVEATRGYVRDCENACRSSGM